MLEEKRLFNEKYLNTTVICGLIGAAAFFIIYGYVPLIFNFDQWIIDSFVEQDILQHYAGWMFFYNSPWSFPLGLAANTGYPNGVVISFTDSIPVASIFFRLLAPILPETFQFFGIYTLICFILQGISSSWLIKLFTEQKWMIIFGSILFCFSPVMIERAFRHTALGSHFLIVFALFLYFKAKKSESPWIPWAFVALNMLSIGIHPYFFPIIMGMTIVTSIEHAMKHKKFVQISSFFAANVFATLLFGYVIGLFGTGAQGGGWGFGVFSMNLNAIFNPSALGPWEWSRIFRVLPQTLGNYDGFNYLGGGVLLITCFLFAYACLRIDVVKRYVDIHKIKTFMKEHAFLILFCLGMTIFAISNVVTFNDHILFEYTLPTFVLRFAAIFRASSRMFYITYYIIFLCVILVILKFKPKKRMFLIALLVFIQLFDISPAVIARNQHFSSYTQYLNAAADHPSFSDILPRFDYFILVDHEWMNSRLAIEVARHGLRSNGTPIVARRSTPAELDRQAQFRQQWHDALRTGNPNPQTIYAFAYENIFWRYYSNNYTQVIPVMFFGLWLLVPRRFERMIAQEYIITAIPDSMP